MNKVISFFTLITALIIAGVAAWFSVAGLMAIFSGAALAVAIMAGSLEIGKLVTATWLKFNWHSSGFLLRYFLSLAVLVLMFITSMGTFGYLSKAHVEQNASLGQDSLKIERIDQQIERETKKINDAETVIAQLDETVNTLVANSRISGPNGAREVRENQKQEREELNLVIRESQAIVDILLDEKMNLEQGIKSVELEVGPIRYIANLVYGETDKNTLEKAVQWVIIILVLVFDPLAVMMLVAANHSLIQEFKKKDTGSDKFIDNDKSPPTQPTQPTPPIPEDEEIQIDIEKASQISVDGKQEIVHNNEEIKAEEFKHVKSVIKKERKAKPKKSIPLPIHKKAEKNKETMNNVAKVKDDIQPEKEAQRIMNKTVRAIQARPVE